MMAFLTLEDLYGTSEVVVFPKTFEKDRPEVLEWAKEVDSTIFAAEWKIITSAFNNYFRVKSRKLSHYVGAPKFKNKKKDKISITFTSQNKPRILKNGYLFLTRKLAIPSKYKHLAFCRKTI